MKTIALDTDGDFLTGTNNSLSYVEGIDYIVTRIKQKVRLFLGEWFLDTTIGIPYFQSVLTKGYDLSLLQITLVEAISSVVGVGEIIYYEQYVADRTLTVEMKILTTSGEVLELSESL